MTESASTPHAVARDSEAPQAAVAHQILSESQISNHKVASPDERLRGLVKTIEALFTTTTVPSEWQAALKWRSMFLNQEWTDEPEPLDPQIVAFLIADCESFRAALQPIRDLSALLQSCDDSQKTEQKERMRDHQRS